MNHFESGCVTIWLYYPNKVANTAYFKQNFVNMILPIYMYVKF